MRWFLLSLPALLLVACGGSPQADQTEPSQARQTVSQAEPSAEYDPDRESLFRLVFWDPFAEFGILPGAPPAFAAEIETLAASNHPGAAKYLIDLAGVPTPYSNQILGLLAEQFARPNPRSIFSFPELFQFPAEDSQTDAYLSFKQVLYGSVIPQFGDFLNPLRPRTIDAREVV